MANGEFRLLGMMCLRVVLAEINSRCPTKKTRLPRVCYVQVWVSESPSAQHPLSSQTTITGQKHDTSLPRVHTPFHLRCTTAKKRVQLNTYYGTMRLIRHAAYACIVENPFVIVTCYGTSRLT